MEIIKFIQGFSNPFLDIVFQLITMVGEDTFFILVVATMYWCIDKEMGYKLAFVTITGTVVNISIKEIFKVPRPIGQPGIRSLRLKTAGGYSFPSGHTQSTSTLCTFFMLEFRRNWIYALGICMILLVALSRLYLGVHTPLDVAGGAIVGAVWVVIWDYIDKLSKKYDSKMVLLIVIIPALLGLAVFRTNDYYKAAGALLGLFAGYLIEPRYINFKVEAGLMKQAVKLAVGLAVAILLRLLLKIVFPEALLSDFIRYFILLIWITIAAPLMFKRL